MTFLAKHPEYQSGIAVITYPKPSRQKHKQIAGLKEAARFVSLKEIVDDARLSTSKDVDSSDFVFVPCKKQAFTKKRSGKALGEWAHENNLSDVNVHDNDHVWFCGFPMQMEKQIFIEFLKASVFDINHRTPRISREIGLLLEEVCMIMVTQ